LTLGMGESRKPVPLWYRTPNIWEMTPIWTDTIPYRRPCYLNFWQRVKKVRNPAANTEGVCGCGDPDNIHIPSLINVVLHRVRRWIDRLVLDVIVCLVVLRRLWGFCVAPRRSASLQLESVEFRTSGC
jgi:hypothetical protein